MSLLVFVKQAVTQICKQLGDSIIAKAEENNGAEFLDKVYCGCSFTPDLQMNLEIIKVIEQLASPTHSNEAELESKLLKLLISKRAALLVAEAVPEVEEQAELISMVKEIVKSPEVKKRRKRRAEERDRGDVLCGEQNIQLDVNADVGDSTVTLVADSQSVVTTDGFGEIETCEFVGFSQPVSEPVATDKVEITSPTVSTSTTMEEFLEQEKLNALNALNEPEL